MDLLKYLTKNKKGVEILFHPLFKEKACFISNGIRQI